MTDRYYDATQPGATLPADDETSSCDGSLVVVRVPGEAGEVAQAELDQYFCRDGFFRLATSHRLPPELMARAVAAAWRVVEAEAMARHA